MNQYRPVMLRLVNEVRAAGKERAQVRTGAVEHRHPAVGEAILFRLEKVRHARPRVGVPTRGAVDDGADVEFV